MNLKNTVGIPLLFAWGYKRKSTSIIIFTSLFFIIVVLLFNILENSFNSWFTNSVSYSIPPLYAVSDDNFDLFQSKTIRDVVLRKDVSQLIFSELSDDYDIYKGIVITGFFVNSSDENYSVNALIVAVDFSKINEIFPALNISLSEEEKDEYSKRPLMIVNETFKQAMITNEGSSFILLTEDFYRDINAMKYTIQQIISHPVDMVNLIDRPIVYIDLNQISRVFCLPDDYSFPLILKSKKGYSVYDISNKIDLKVSNCYFYTAQAISKEIYKTYSFYKSLLSAIVVILSIILCIAISSISFLHYQSRTDDYRLLKALGCSRCSIVLFVLIENYTVLITSAIIAILVNFIIMNVLHPIQVTSSFYLSARLNPTSILCITSIVLFTGIISIWNTAIYLSRVSPLVKIR